MTYYLQNISDRDLVDPMTGEVLKAGHVKFYDNEFRFLRMLALFNGEVRVLSEREYYEIINNPPFREREVEAAESSEEETQPRTRGRKKAETSEEA